MKYNFFLIILLFPLISTQSGKINYSEPYDPTPKITKFSIGMARYFLRFSAMAYCPNSIISKDCCHDFLQKEGWSIKAHGKVETTFENNFAIYRNDKYQKVVVAFPGTRGFLQLMDEILESGLQSIKIKDDKYSEIKIGKYFYKRADSLKSKVLTNLKYELSKTKEYQIIFTGHSLGAAMATIMAYFAKINGVTNHVVLLTFGQPRTGNDVFSNEVMKAVDKVFRVVRAGDIVPTIPFSIIGSSPRFRDSKFDYSYFPKDDLTKLENRLPWNNIYWSLGGLVLIDENQETYQIYDYDQGENLDNCKIYGNILGIQRYHNDYFGLIVKDECAAGKNED